MTILIAGGGIAGLALGLTLHQIGQPFRIFETAAELRPLGVGINLQPTAVRELDEMGLGGALADMGIRTKDTGFYTRTGVEIWTEPRGRAAGYRWPQYSVHRGRLAMMLRDALVARAGPDVIATGQRVMGYETDETGVILRLASGDRVTGALLVGADGIHSAVRAQMVPGEGPPIWSGAILWRGVSRAKPFLSGASMILAGNDHVRLVAYPIGPADPADGCAEINWIAERRVDPAAGYQREDWNRAVGIEAFLPTFEDWRFDWLDVPALIRAADRVYEYPMVDRDPLETWRDGRVTLIGDAAHATYPVGSNGASQAILDARFLGAAIRAEGVTGRALDAYDAKVRPGANGVIAANRGQGPDAVMQMAEDLTGGDFSKLDALFPIDARRAHAARYKVIAGLDVQGINARASILPG